MEGEGGSVRVEKVSNKAEKEVRLKGRKEGTDEGNA